MMFRKGQTLLEYTVLVGLVTIAMISMGTLIKRGTQSLVKVTADQIGNQEDADQNFKDPFQGHLDSSRIRSVDSRRKNRTELLYVTNVIEDDQMTSVTNTITNGGFSPS